MQILSVWKTLDQAISFNVLYSEFLDIHAWLKEKIPHTKKSNTNAFPFFFNN